MAILALIVFTVLGYGSYKSMLPEEWFDFMSREARAVVVEEEAVTLDEAVEVIDSLVVSDDVLNADEENTEILDSIN